MTDSKTESVQEGAVDEAELSNFVSWTSRLVAACRAIETAEPDAVCSDPLAQHFAGAKAMDYVGTFAREQPQQAAAMLIGLPAKPGQKRRVSGIAVRTCYFDLAILAACNGNSSFAGIECTQPIRQVVLLGAGQDARPWRLQLPSGVRCYEVDQSDVVRAKEILLGRMGAALQTEDNASAQFPLAAAECHRLSADLTLDGWPAALEAKGFQKSQPTLWHAEGLLNYLSAAAVEKLLRDLSQTSAPGSLFTATMIADTTLVDQAARHTEQRFRERYSSVWGAPTPPDKTKGFMASCGWRVLEMTEMREAAQAVAPSMQCHFFQQEKEGDFLYYFVTAAVALHTGS
ncbi:hypothetical protein WJX73_006965 [Symbiochloris irregularis]|uniref:S-adenosyl-L-methionine-dependent methyltransferase n=1 Tax=Symbiochloris irregularis TaxID=706552 RepID=A0AAW1PAJ5_9CHLO